MNPSSEVEVINLACCKCGRWPRDDEDTLAWTTGGEWSERTGWTWVIWAHCTDCKPVSCSLA